MRRFWKIMGILAGGAFASFALLLICVGAFSPTESTAERQNEELARRLAGRDQPPAIVDESPDDVLVHDFEPATQAQ